MNKGRTAYRALVGPLAIALWACPAVAQTTPQSTTEPEADASPTDIVVTATKRAENVQDVPISISAVTSDVLARQGVSGLARLDVLVPGFKFGQSGNDARPAIRGTRTQQVIGNADPLVAYYADGVYRSRPGQGLSPYFDIERVEVARGPQGTLFGRNSFGGAINIITRGPKLGTSDVGLAIEGGSYRSVKGEGFANIALGENAAFRISAYSSRRDGWVHNTGRPGNDLHDDQTQAIRGEFKFEVGGFTNVTRAEYWHGGGAGPGDFGYYTPGVPVSTTIAPALPASGTLPAVGPIRLTNGVSGTIDPVISTVPGRGGGYGGLPAGTLGDGNWRSISRGYEFKREVNQTALSNETNLDVGFADARLILSYTKYKEYRQGDPDYALFKQDGAYNRVSAETYSEEFQLISKPGGPFSWVVGSYLLQDTPTDTYVFGTDNTGNTTAVGGVSLNEADNTPFNLYVQGPFTSKTDSIAFYGDGTYKLTDALRIVGGLRWTRDKRTATIDNVPFAGSPVTYGSVNVTEGPQRRTFEKLTYRGGAQYDVARHSMLYATYSTGYLAGGFSGAPSFSTTTSSLTSYNPQEATAIEVGSKNTFLDGKLRANISAYRNVYTNLVTQKLVQVGNAISTTTANAGKIRSWGVEGEFDLYPNDAAYLGLRLAYTHARFGDYVVGNNFTEGGNVGVQDRYGNFGSFQLNGLQVPLNPDFTGTLIGSYEFDAGPAGTFTPSATVFYSSSYRTSDQPYFFASQGSYTTLDASLRWKPSKDSKLSVMAFGRNITDERILLRSTPNAGSVIYQDFADPAMYGVRLSFNY